MKKDISGTELIISKSFIYKECVTAIKQDRVQHPHIINWDMKYWLFDNTASIKGYAFPWNVNTEKPYTCLISVKTIFSNN